MKTEGLIGVAAGLVKKLQGRINSGGIGLDKAEAQILELVNWIGDAMAQEAVAGFAEPTTANQITNRRKNGSVRAGTESAVHQPVWRRGGAPYRYRDRAGCVAPIDIRLAIIASDFHLVFIKELNDGY